MIETRVHQVLFYDYVADVAERRKPFRDAHLAHIRDWQSTGRLVSAGALGNPPSGGLLVFLVEDPAQVEDFVASDPYMLNAIVTGHRVVPWAVVV